MQPIDDNKPGIGLFLLMTGLYFATYFGLKYGVFGGELPILLNVALIGACLALVFFVRGRAR